MALNVDLVHLYPMDNAKAHHTDRFEIVHAETPVPVMRRGQSFNMAIRFSNRDYMRSKDLIRIIFNCGDAPNPLKGTRGIVFLKEKEICFNTKKWEGKITNYQTQEIVVEIMTPCDAPIGPWEIIIETLNGRDSSKYTYDGDFWLLFNPWAKDDIVYMPDTQFLDEYILSDVGKVWVGPYGSNRGREWVYGQFDKSILPASILMLDRANVRHENRHDPISISRALSRIVNSNDDYGVLVGRWDGDYRDGTAPSAWTGSVDILEQFLETEAEVKYGQCWVFAGVLTTVARALGIPSRVVSNLVSAHDSNGSLTVDKYYDKDNNELDHDPSNPNGADSVWNYHVWNDVYMARPDLPKGYGGWQAVDSTPQETSSGFYQCGPASLEAIRQGEVGFNYDVPFMVASVNADFMKWKEDENSVYGFKRIDSNEYHIGREIITKKPFVFDPNGDKDREDIIAQYKPDEGSKGERLSLMNAVGKTITAKRFFDVPEAVSEDVIFKLSDLERIDIGKPFNVTLEIKNTSSERRNVEVIITIGSIYYNGVRAKTIKRTSGERVIKPNDTDIIKLSIPAKDYLEKLVEYSIIKIFSICTVKETKQTWAGEDDFQVIKPPIKIVIEKELDVGQPQPVTLTFKNPLNIPLTKCKFNLSGPGLIRKTIPLEHKDAGPEGVLSIQTTITPWQAGPYKLVATFISVELNDVTGSASVDVF